MTLVVILTVRRKSLDAFRAFERTAASVMRRRGGRIERSLLVDLGPDLMKEVHIVTFPSEKALSAYRDDDELALAAHLRKESVVEGDHDRRRRTRPWIRPGALHFRHAYRMSLRVAGRISRVRSRRRVRS